MPNHVHLILTPEDGEGLALALGKAHRLYAGFVDARARQTGHLFQGRFGSVALDEEHLMNMRRAMWRSIPCGLGSSGAPKTGRIRACARIWPGATTGSSASGRCSSRAPHSPT